MATRRLRLPFRIPFFRIFYSTTYMTLWIIVLIFLAVTPASLIFFAIEAAALQYLFMIGGTYFVTLVTAIFIYSSRLYTNRIVLAGIGKSWIPVEDGEVVKKVRKMVVQALERSALVAYECRPRDLSKQVEQTHHEAGNAHERHHLIHSSSDLVQDTKRAINVNPVSPPWGRVEHAGWSSPSEADAATTPHIYYMSIITELPNLIEARAVSLAPPSPVAEGTSAKDAPTTDAQTVAMLQRPPLAGLRDYLAYLDSLGLVIIPDCAEHFLNLFEHARFSGYPLSEKQFQALMGAFADLLSGMNSVTYAEPPFISINDTSEKPRNSSYLAPHQSSISISSDESPSNARKTNSLLPSVYAATPTEEFSTPRPDQRETSQASSGQSSDSLRNGSFGSVVRTRYSDVQSTSSSDLSSLRSARSARSVIRLTPSPRTRSAAVRMGRR